MLCSAFILLMMEEAVIRSAGRGTGGECDCKCRLRRPRPCLLGQTPPAGCRAVKWWACGTSGSCPYDLASMLGSLIEKDINTVYPALLHISCTSRFGFGRSRIVRSGLLLLSLLIMTGSLDGDMRSSGWNARRRARRERKVFALYCMVWQESGNPNLDDNEREDWTAVELEM